jgi:uncharacterized protein YndB with AHSA1/START domain
VRAKRSRALGASAERVWDVVGDPYQLPRWWPRVTRVESVDEHAWTTILGSPRGRDVRADWRLVASEAPVRRRWAQELAGSPFERLFVQNEVEVRVEGEQVTIEIEQRVRGWARLAPFIVRRAAKQVADEALDGLAAIL